LYNFLGSCIAYLGVAMIKNFFYTAIAFGFSLLVAGAIALLVKGLAYLLTHNVGG
jgi:hypothetical protein